MKYIVKNADNQNLIMDVISSIPQLPEGWEVLGKAEEINPNNLDLARCSLVDGLMAEDTDKTLIARQIIAQANLDSIRSLRLPLLDSADHDINTLEDNSGDASALRAYRKALRECTDSLKKVNGDAKLSCESLVPAEFEFPVKS